LAYSNLTIESVMMVVMSLRRNYDVVMDLRLKPGWFGSILRLVWFSLVRSGSTLQSNRTEPNTQTKPTGGSNQTDCSLQRKCGWFGSH